MVIIVQVLKEKWLKITGFAHSQTTNKRVNEAANDSARVSGQDRKILPALGTNQIAGFGGFRPLASLKKYRHLLKTYINDLNLSYEVDNIVTAYTHDLTCLFLPTRNDQRKTQK